MLATNVKMTRKELKNWSLSLGTDCYQTAVLCFENNKNDLDDVMLLATEVLKSWLKRNHFRLAWFSLRSFLLILWVALADECISDERLDFCKGRGWLRKGVHFYSSLSLQFCLWYGVFKLKCLGLVLRILKTDGFCFM